MRRESLSGEPNAKVLVPSTVGVWAQAKKCGEAWIWPKLNPGSPTENHPFCALTHLPHQITQQQGEAMFERENLIKYANWNKLVPIFFILSTFKSDFRIKFYWIELRSISNLNGYSMIWIEKYYYSWAFSAVNIHFTHPAIIIGFCLHGQNQ